MDEINPLSKFLSPLISFICRKDTISVGGSVAVQLGIISGLGIICGTGIICRPESFAGLYSTLKML